MSSAENLITRLLDNYHLLLELITRLNELSSSKEIRQELADTIHNRIKEYEIAIESLEIQTENNNEKSHLVSLDRLKENLRLARLRFRKAQIQSKKNTELYWQNERELLFTPVIPDNTNTTTRPTIASRPLSTKDLLVSKSEDITSTLRRVHQMAQTEVVKSSLNIEELDYSTKTLKQLEHKYSAFDVMLNGSQRLVRHLEEADKWDRIYMLTSLAFLALVLAWIVWRRIVKAPTMLLVWVLARFFRLVQPSPGEIIDAKSSLLATASAVHDDL